MFRTTLISLPRPGQAIKPRKVLDFFTSHINYWKVLANLKDWLSELCEDLRKRKIWIHVIDVEMSLSCVVMSIVMKNNTKTKPGMAHIKKRLRWSPCRGVPTTTSRGFRPWGGTRPIRETSRPKIPASGRVRASPTSAWSWEGWRQVRTKNGVNFVRAAWQRSCSNN